MKHYYLGQASNYRLKDVLRHLFAFGTKSDEKLLIDLLAERYHTVPSHVFLTRNGRSAIALALKSLNLKKHSEVIINGFTCYAVVQAVKSAGFTPIYADISRENLNFSVDELKNLLEKHTSVSAIIIQNTLGLPVDYQSIRALAEEKGLKIIEDMAHCAGLRYENGVEIGTIGDAACFSFGKGKSLDSITGGALVLNHSIPDSDLPTPPSSHPRLSDTLRARWYPVFGSFGRFFDKLGLGKYWYGPLIRLHFITRAVDEPLDLRTRPAYWQDRLIYKKIKSFKKDEKPIRTFNYVKNRDLVLKNLEKSGFHFREIWYDVPVSPVRYYKSLNFPETDCKVATRVSKEIINLPSYYKKSELNKARKIIEEYQIYD